MEVLRLENLSKFYTSESSVVVGLNGVSLSFSTGEFVALTGESGSGKSTLAHVLGGILPYESGELYIYGKPTSHYDAYDWSRYRRDLISFISQSYGILPGNTVAENIESALRLSGLSVEEAQKRAVDILEEVELTEFRKRKAGKLSSGQKQRLSIARALAKPSGILIADEPTGNLDRENSEKIIALLKRASKDRLVILITHEFEEAKDVATRRIILSDGAVVTDAKLREGERSEKPEAAPADSAKVTKKKQKPLPPYVCRLTLKSRPVFSGILVLLLAVTMFISFVFVGNFVIALDDTTTRVYHSDAFINGSPNRLVVMRSDRAALTEADYNTILSMPYVESVDRYGAANDLAYHYQKDIDHTEVHRIVLGEKYNEILNPNDFTIEITIDFIEKYRKYVRSFPCTEEDILTSGRAPESTYEVVSADPNYKVGDTVRVYIRNIKDWRSGANLPLDLEVVGTTEYGSGIYFSDKLVSALINPIYPLEPVEPYRQWGLKFIFLPYDPSLFGFCDIPTKEEVLTENQYPQSMWDRFTEERLDEVILTDDRYVFPENTDKRLMDPFLLPTADGGTVALDAICVNTVTLVDFNGEPVVDQYGKPAFLEHFYAEHDLDNKEVVCITEATFDRVVNLSSNQISVYIKDYSYTERVSDSLKAAGYMPLSPYQIGATEVNEGLSRERLITLAVCAATFLIAFVLQCILLRVMFSSLFEYYKLMANTGLTVGIAFGAVSLMLLVTTLLGEALGAGVILALNAASVTRVVNIFKFLDAPTLAILFSLHFVTVLFSLWSILVSLKKHVFGKGKSTYDIDFTLMEEDMQHD